MKRNEVIKIINSYIEKNDLIVSSTGYITRELFKIADSPQIFYMMGSMGLASSIGLGLAICCPKRRIIVIEGDGSIIMNMGSIATVAHYAPRNLIHIVLDNEVYESTGGQPTVSRTANLDKIAKNTGYKKVIKITSKIKLKKMIRDYFEFNFEGPKFILIKVEKSQINKKIKRVPYEPEHIKNYFKKFIETTTP
jgi:thiamine pyrophosphate-dependent acetolactate synthase large subunit-like protein